MLHARLNEKHTLDEVKAAQVRVHVLKKLRASIKKNGDKVDGISYVGSILNPKQLCKAGVDTNKHGSAQWTISGRGFRITMAFTTEIRGPDSLELTRVMRHNSGSVKALLRDTGGKVQDWASPKVRDSLRSVVIKHQQETGIKDLCWICARPKTQLMQDGIHRCMVKSRFTCQTCNHIWGSGCAWINPINEQIKNQRCSKCGNTGVAEGQWEPHERGKGSGDMQPKEKQHRQDLCEACIEWGDCRSLFYQPNVVNGAISLACGAQNMHWFADEEGIKTKLVYNGHENEVVVQPFVRVRVGTDPSAEAECLRFFDNHINYNGPLDRREHVVRQPTVTTVPVKPAHTKPKKPRFTPVIPVPSVEDRQTDGSVTSSSAGASNRPTTPSHSEASYNGKAMSTTGSEASVYLGTDFSAKKKRAGRPGRGDRRKRDRRRRNGRKTKDDKSSSSLSETPSIRSVSDTSRTISSPPGSAALDGSVGSLEVAPAEVPLKPLPNYNNKSSRKSFLDHADPRAFVDRLEQLCRARREENLTAEQFEQLKKDMFNSC